MEKIWTTRSQITTSKQRGTQGQRTIKIGLGTHGHNIKRKGWDNQNHTIIEKRRGTQDQTTKRKQSQRTIEKSWSPQSRTKNDRRRKHWINGKWPLDQQRASKTIKVD